ncbi:putative integral membrane protein TIGR02587 [Rhizobium sp. NFR07]|uniref:TIGR02587 family membrane protein n=1 Tax=Rhizobium sp. NFR07 TaxID=1566262 RepID=UPI0008F2F749|nr:TIGR02587 family membrane protein [Rhizobium sp. NFR07]SFB50616.1 putative integral membrane protein TIGR02587 [Rhizobium sp. NFR07]
MWGSLRHGQSGSGESRKFLIGLGRGAAGALLFGVPMLMTMELWELGFYMERYRLLLLLLVNIPLLVFLADRVGFERTTTLTEACRDANIAFGLAILMSAGILSLFGNIKFGMPVSEIAGKIAIQAVPASIGALLGRSQLGGSSDDQGDDGKSRSDDGKQSAQSENGDAVPDRLSTSYSQELLLMAVGALFLNLNVAPTEEIVLISFKMTAWHTLIAIMITIGIMHAFVYVVAFKGTHELPAGTPWWHAFFRFTLPGYLVALAVSLFVLWTFGRVDAVAPTQALMFVIVLSFPGAIGAAAARLIL